MADVHTLATWGQYEGKQMAILFNEMSQLISTALIFAVLCRG